MGMYQDLALLAITGLAVGFASGTLGVGGCFLMVPVQYWLLVNAGLDPTIATRMAFGTGLAVVLPTTISSASMHWNMKAVNCTAGLYLGISGMVGASIGSYMASIVGGDILRMAFGLVVTISAVRLALYNPLDGDRHVKSRLRSYIFWGFLSGVLSGLCGIGGGVILVPIMIVFLGFDIHMAVGTSTMAIALISLGGISSYIINGLGIPGLPVRSLGYVNLVHWAVLAVTSVPTARIGARFSHKLPSKELKYIFILVMIYVGFKMILSAI